MLGDRHVRIVALSCADVHILVNARAERIRPRTREAGDMLRARYRAALRGTVAASAAPYGYTLTIWTSGAVLSHARGIPGSVEALLFLVGAVAAYALVGGFAYGGLSERAAPEPAPPVVFGGLHLFSVGLAIGAASLVAHFVNNIAAWPLAGFLGTALYLLVSASQLGIAQATRGGRVKG